MNPPATMQTDQQALLRECAVFCRYLVGRDASPFIAQKYAEAHARSLRFEPAASFDRIVLRVATASPFLAQCADSYVCVAARTSLLRKKLVLLVAILESSAPVHGFDELVTETPAASVIARMAGRGLLFGMRFALALVFLAPLHFACMVRGGPEGRA